MTIAMPIRRDLMELGLEALMALANPGFVKRAQKDVAAGALPVLGQDADGSVHALFDDGVRTSIAAAASLRDAACTCAASAMCRHRVTLVLAYQAAHAATVVAAGTAAGAADEAANWSPAQFDDAALAAAFTPQVLEQARKLALGRPLATVLAGAQAGDGDGARVPSVYLPMSHVRFFSSSSLAHARCDCQQGLGCAHVVLAAWACRLARQSQPGVAEVTLEVLPFGRPAVDGEGTNENEGLMQTAAAAALADALRDWLWSIWRDGSSQALLGLEARYETLRAGLQTLGWTWVGGELDSVWHMLQAQAQRSNRFDALDLIDAMARLWARVQAAKHADTTPGARLPASQILGVGQAGEVALDLLRLISLGAQFWRDDVNQGASVVFADPDTQAVSVLERCWPREGNGDDAGGADAILKRRVGGLSLKLLAGAQVVTRAAKRRANASLELGPNARQTSAMPLSPKSWDDLLAPLKFSRLEALIDYLRSRPPPCVRPGQAGATWQVLELDGLELDEWAWDAAQQTLFACWNSERHSALRAYLPHRQLTPGAVDALARALDGEWGALRCVAGPVWLEQGGVGIQPMSLLTEQRAIVLALEPAAPRHMRLRETPLPASARQTLLRESQYLLGQLLRQGIRHAPPSQRSRLGAQADQLADAGYPQAAALLRAAFVEGRAGPVGQATGLAALSALSLLLADLLA